MKLAILVFLAERLRSVMWCKTDFLTSIGVDGERNPKFSPMLLCPDVGFSCCSVFDELRFHKNWYHFYRPKLNLTYARIERRFLRLSKAVAFFQGFPMDKYGSRVFPEMMTKANQILNDLKVIVLDPELRPIINELKTLRKFDVDLKKTYFCAVCDFKNHEYFVPEQRLVVNANFCQNIISRFGKMLQIRTKLLNKILLAGLQFIDLFDTPIYFRNRPRLQNEVQRNIDLVSKCFPDTKSGYDFNNCEDLCNEYSLTSLSPAFIGEFEFYDFFFKKFDDWKCWLEKKPKASSSNQTQTASQNQTSNQTTKPVAKKKLALRLLSSDNSMKKKIRQLTKSLNKYKNMIKSLGKYNSHYLKPLYDQISVEDQNKKETRRLAPANKTNQTAAPAADLFGNRNCTNCEDARLSINSRNVKQSKNISSSVNITNSENVTNSTNISNSINVSLSRNVSDSKNVTNTNFTKQCVNCRGVRNSSNCTNCTRCRNCTNCINCHRCVNVTGCRNCRNVTNGTNLTDVTNGTNVRNVRRSTNVRNVVNSTNLTNATNASNAHNNYNCTGLNCRRPRPSPFQRQIDAELRYRGEMIINQLYRFYRAGDLRTYRLNPTQIDWELFGSRSRKYVVDKLLFADEGLNLEYNTGRAFVRSARRVKANAYTNLTRMADPNEDLPFRTKITARSRVHNRTIEYLNNQIDLDFAFEFMTDIDKSTLSEKYIRNITCAENNEDEMIISGNITNARNATSSSAALTKLLKKKNKKSKI